MNTEQGKLVCDDGEQLAAAYAAVSLAQQRSKRAWARRARAYRWFLQQWVLAGGRGGVPGPQNDQADVATRPHYARYQRVAERLSRPDGLEQAWQAVQALIGPCCRPLPADERGYLRCMTAEDCEIDNG